MAAGKQGSTKTSDSWAQQTEQIRQMAEAAKLTTPVGYSVDGRTFGYEAPMNFPVSVGAYVTINSRGAIYLGQISTQEVALREGPEYGTRITASGQFFVTQAAREANFVERVQIRFIQGTGEIIAKVMPNGLVRTTNQDVFDDAKITSAPTETIARHLGDHKGANHGLELEIGYAMAAEVGKARVHLQQQGFRRHTFMCGQSRSGKTFALGVILEQLLLSEDAPRIIVLDPNSDFVRLSDIRDKTATDITRQTPLTVSEYSAICEGYAKVAKGIRIIRPESEDALALRVRLSDLDRYEQGAILQLHPVKDLHAFNVFGRVVEDQSKNLYSWADINTALLQNPSPSSLDLALRIQNLRVSDWGVWCKTKQPSLAQELRRDDWKCMVIDIGSLPSAEQRSVALLAVLNYLWNSKQRTQPVMLIADEAHNVCPQVPANQLEEIAVDYFVRIAGEGLKYGLRLLLASQRPAKIHSNVLSQCENLVLMRMTSGADIAGLTHAFSQVAPPLIARSRYFAQGEALIIGEIVKGPIFTKFEGRLTVEGGGDTQPTKGLVRTPS